MTNDGLHAEIGVHLGSLTLEAGIDVSAGELVVVVGPNGAGKSTLLRSLIGLLAISRGQISLDGRMLDEPSTNTFIEPARRSIGVVFQDQLLFNHLSVVDNVAFGLRATGNSRQESRHTAMAWLERFHLTNYAASSPSELSGGQAQRVSLARALAMTPKLLLLDEPLAALDTESHRDVSSALREHLAELTIPKIFVTHNPIEAITFGNRIVVLEAGRITQSGSSDEVRTRPRSRYIAEFVGVNLIHGDAVGTTITMSDGHQIVTATNVATPARVTATIHPRSITLHTTQPDGSARNSWRSVVATIDNDGERVRVQVGRPAGLAVEITPAACAELSLVPGMSVWISFKATEVAVQQD